MKYIISALTGHCLEGRCPHCDHFLVVSIIDKENDDVDNYPDDFDFGSIKSIKSKCHNCLRYFTAVNNGRVHNNDISQEVRDNSPRIVMRSSPAPAANTFACTHCGAQRPYGARFCPYCRLDGAGRSADAGAFYG